MRGGPSRKIAFLSALATLGIPSPSSAQAAKPWKPVTSIDFSSKHDILIQNFDDTLVPMDQPFFQSRLIAPGTWQIMADGDYMYLVEGDREALLIDGGYGAGNIRAYAQSLTRKPLHNIANTHFHFDHVANDGYFDRAFMSQGTKDGLPKPTGSFAGIPFPANYPITVIEEGYKFDLGNRTLEAIMLGNHTPGGTAYLDRKRRILFIGDEIMGAQGIALHMSVERFAQLMDTLAAHRGEFDTLCAGWEMLDASWVDKYRALAKSVLAGNLGMPANQAPPAPLPYGWRTTPKVVPSKTVFLRHRPRQSGPLPPGVFPGAGQPALPGTENIMRASLDGATITYDRMKLRG